MSVSRLSTSAYKRPGQTYTEKLTEDQIVKLLEGYERVTKIDTVPIGTHLRYFRKAADGTEQFRTGGVLHKNQGLPEYIVLSNGKATWSVQTKDVKFFKKLTQDEIADSRESKMKKLKQENKTLKSRVKKLESEK